MTNTLFGDSIISSTDLKNNQRKWFEKALKNPISITNTGGKQFVLINRQQAYNLVLARDYMIQILKYCKAIANSSKEKEFVSETFAWAKHLTQEDRLRFSNELMSALNEAIQSNDWTQLDEIISSWEATAEAMTNTRFMEVVESDADKREYTEVE